MPEYDKWEGSKEGVGGGPEQSRASCGRHALPLTTFVVWLAPSHGSWDLGGRRTDMQTDVHDISNVVVVVIQDLSPSISHSSFLSSFLPILDSCHRHYTFSRPSSSLSANRMKIALSEKFKYGHATPQRDRMDGGEGAVRKRKGGGMGGGHLQMKTASICQNGDLDAAAAPAIKTQWPRPPPPPLLHTLRLTRASGGRMQEG